MRACSAESGAAIITDHAHRGPGRKFLVSGAPADVAHCKRLIERRLRSCQPDRPLTMWIPLAKTGKVIGVGGATIRAINSTTGANAVVRNDRVDGNCKQVLISGPRDAAYRAQQLIIDLVEDRPCPLLDRAETMTMHIPDYAVGAVIGRGGSTLKALQVRSAAAIRVAADDQATESHRRLVTISGSFDAIQTAREMVQNIADHASPLKDTFSSRDRYDTPPHSDTWARSKQPFGARNDTHEESFQLPSNVVGLLVGRNGSTVRDIEARSKAFVSCSGKSDSTDKAGSTTTVRIVGEQTSVMIAKLLIEDRLKLRLASLSTIGEAADEQRSHYVTHGAEPDAEFRRTSVPQDKEAANEHDDDVDSTQRDGYKLIEKEHRFAAEKENGEACDDKSSSGANNREYKQDDERGDEA